MSLGSLVDIGHLKKKIAHSLSYCPNNMTVDGMYTWRSSIFKTIMCEKDLYLFGEQVGWKTLSCPLLFFKMLFQEKALIFASNVNINFWSSYFIVNVS